MGARVRAALAVVAVLAAGACGSEAQTPDLTGQGPITLVTGKDLSGNLANQVAEWNQSHPDQKVTIIELPEGADGQRQQLVQNARTRSDAYTVLNLDVVWTAEFAANQWIVPLERSDFPLDKLLPATVRTAEYFGKLYGVPTNSDGGMLYYRKDLLDAAGLRPPTTWDEMYRACDAVIAANPGLGCYAGQFEQYEGLTVNFSEAVHSAGGDVVDKDGKPRVDTPEAKRGLDFLVDGVKQGRIPEKARTFKEEEGRRSFQAGELLFHRQWPYQYLKAAAQDGSSSVAGKFAVAPLPGLSGPGSSTLGGHNLAVSAYAKNRRTGVEFIKYLSGEDQQRKNLENSSQAPTWAALYDEPALVAKFPYLTVLKQSILSARERPSVVKYQEVSTRVQNAAYSAMSGKKSTSDALRDLQRELADLLGK